MGGDGLRMVGSLEARCGAPGLFGDEQEGVEVRHDADFVAEDLIVAAADVLGLGGGQAIGGFEFGSFAAAGAALGQFAGVILEIIVDAFQFAAEAVLLAGANAGEVIGEFAQNGLLKERIHVGEIKGGPRNFGGRGRVAARVKGELTGEIVVGLAARQGEGEAMQRPMLVDGLDFTTKQGDEGEMAAFLERSGQSPVAGLGELGAPEFFGDRGFGRARRSGIGQDEAVEADAVAAKGVGQSKRQGAAGEDFTGGVAGAGGVGGSEEQLDFMQRSRGVPEFGGRAFGEDLEAIVPGAFADGAKGGETFLVEFEKGAGIVSGAGEAHLIADRGLRIGDWWRR
jgi:hypothetical protein